MKKGFTLIELLVVISIIGVLMGLLLVAYQGTRKSARDGKRKTDIEQIRSALEIYRSDCGSYPSSLAFGSSLTGPVGAPCAGNNYMTVVPKDPLDPTYAYFYRYGDANYYALCASLETGTGSSVMCGSNCGRVDGAGRACNYDIRNP